jgi:hypothetical protein
LRDYFIDNGCDFCYIPDVASAVSLTQKQGRLASKETSQQGRRAMKSNSKKAQVSLFMRTAFLQAPMPQK